MKTVAFASQKQLNVSAYAQLKNLHLISTLPIGLQANQLGRLDFPVYDSQILDLMDRKDRRIDRSYAFHTDQIVCNMDMYHRILQVFARMSF